MEILLCLAETLIDN